MTRAGAMIGPQERIRAIKDRQPIAPRPAPAAPAVTLGGTADKDSCQCTSVGGSGRPQRRRRPFGGALAGGILGCAAHPPPSGAGARRHLRLYDQSLIPQVAEGNMKMKNLPGYRAFCPLLLGLFLLVGCGGPSDDELRPVVLL